MRVIAVLDIMGGVVVRGIAGRRSEYRPIRSSLCSSCEPASVARAIIERFGLVEFYIADLDAIAGEEPAWGVYEQIAATGARLLIDAGVGDIGRAKLLADFCAQTAPLAGVIVGLESLSPIGAAESRPGFGDTDSVSPPHPALSPCGGEGLRAAIAPLLEVIAPERLIFSLDLKEGQPLTPVPAWREMSPAQIAAAVTAAGVRRMIVLDLSDVGVGGGVHTLALCQELRVRHADIEFIAGGGVRGPDDLRRMSAAGCNAALVASALHDGRVGKNDV